MCVCAGTTQSNTYINIYTHMNVLLLYSMQQCCWYFRNTRHDQYKYIGYRMRQNKMKQTKSLCFFPSERRWFVHAMCALCLQYIVWAWNPVVVGCTHPPCILYPTHTHTHTPVSKHLNTIHIFFSRCSQFYSITCIRETINASVYVYEHVWVCVVA